jgi:uncharacterized iron-regulated protein
MRKVLIFFVGAIAVLLFWSPANLARASVWCSGAEAIESRQVLEDLGRSQVVYLGETHDDADDHQKQLELIQALYRRKPNLAIALEMFQRPAQPLLDQYLAGTLSEAELQQQSEYDQRWGFPWEYYAPILRFAKARKLRLIALNVPSEITRKVAQDGLEGLTSSDRQWIPPDSEIRTDNVAYRQMIQEVYDQIHQGRSVSSSFDRFFLAQVLWDETMAQGIANFLQKYSRPVVVLAGDGHLVYGYGIPSRVARRVEGVVQRSVILNPKAEDGFGAQTQKVADYFWGDRCPL